MIKNKKIMLCIILVSALGLGAILYNKWRNINIEKTEPTVHESQTQIIDKQQKTPVNNQVGTPKNQQQSSIESTTTSSNVIPELPSQESELALNNSLPSSPAIAENIIDLKKKANVETKGTATQRSIQNTTQSFSITQAPQVITNKEYSIKIGNFSGAPISYQTLKQCDNTNEAFIKSLNYKEHHTFGIVKLNQNESDVIITDPISTREIEGFCIKSTILAPVEGCEDFIDLKNEFSVWKQAIFQRLTSSTPPTSIGIIIHGSPTCGPWYVTLEILPEL